MPICKCIYETDSIPASILKAYFQFINGLLKKSLF